MIAQDLNENKNPEKWIKSTFNPNLLNDSVLFFFAFVQMAHTVLTERLVLRPFTEADLELLHSLYSDPVIMEYMPFDCEDMEASKAHLERIIADWKVNPVVNYEFAILRRDTGDKIGRCHIQIDTETDTGMIGWLLKETEWGKGYATEITGALIDYCFNVIALHRVNALCNPDNKASTTVLKKFMRLEAHYVQKVRYIKNGVETWRDEGSGDELEFALLKSEYKKE